MITNRRINSVYHGIFTVERSHIKDLYRNIFIIYDAGVIRHEIKHAPVFPTDKECKIYSYS